MDRNKHIDNLRGLAMLAMIVIHACSYFLKDKTTYLIWNYLQWAVPLFVFSSFYVFFSRSKKIDIKKRIFRLLKPYYIFLFFYFGLLFFFEKKNFNLNYLSANIFLYKGVDFNWLVLLYVYFTFLMPVVLWMKNKKYLFYGFFVLSFLSSIYFIFQPFNYRLIMWLPWSVFMYFTIFFFKNEKNIKLLNFTAVISLFVFILLYWVEVRIGHNLSHFANKYPPTLYHLSYGIFWVIILYRLSQLKVFASSLVSKFLDFMSLNSYTLYFIHTLVLFVMVWTKYFTQWNWFMFFLVNLGLSSGILMFLKSSQNVFLPKRSQS